MKGLLVAVDLMAGAFCPRPLRGLYDRTVGRRAAAVIAHWNDVGWPDNDDPEEETA